MGCRSSTPLGQPWTGPGGAKYAHAAVTATEIGAGSTKVWIFEPADPAPETAPVVIFLHGWGAWWPVVYEKWIDHLARRGNIVVFPKYQASFATWPTRMTGDAAAGVKNALAKLRSGGHIAPDDGKVAVVGHSLGGTIAANIAAQAKELGVPQPLAVMCVQPGDGKHCHYVPASVMPLPSILADCSTIPKGTLMIVLVGDRDIIVGDKTAKMIWSGIQHLPAADRDYITVVSDDHGSPPLEAHHVFPAAPGKNVLLDWSKARTDALDYYGTWKLLDGLTDAAFYGKNREYALGNTPEQRFMGKWSDGVPIKELQVLQNEKAGGVKE